MFKKKTNKIKLTFNSIHSPGEKYKKLGRMPDYLTDIIKKVFKLFRLGF